MLCHADTSTAVSIAIPLSILSASFFGSAHCAGMCGGLATTMSPNKSSLTAYHLGRLIGYASLGAIAGSLGEASLNAGESYPWLGHLTAIAIAMSLIFMGQNIWQGKSPHPPGSRFISSLFNRVNLRLNRWQLPPILGRFLVGVVTIFLPCGWLYSFVLGAAVTGDVWLGTLFMALFWIGTVPSLIVSTVAVRKLVLNNFASPRLAGAIFIAIGISTLVLRLL